MPLHTLEAAHGFVVFEKLPAAMTNSGRYRPPVQRRIKPRIPVVMRIDGQVRGSDRQDAIDRFTKNESIFASVETDSSSQIQNSDYMTL